MRGPSKTSPMPETRSTIETAAEIRMDQAGNASHQQDNPENDHKTLHAAPKLPQSRRVCEQNDCRHTPAPDRRKEVSTVNENEDLKLRNGCQPRPQPPPLSWQPWLLRKPSGGVWS